MTNPDGDGSDSGHPGPLRGVRITEFEAIGPVPFACGILADLGATVTRITRPGGDQLPGGLGATPDARAHTVALDLKTDEGVVRAWEIIADSDVVIEGFRPGTLERLGLDPTELQRLTPRLIVARVTGWGQDGPYASMAGHDINYIGLTGVLHAVGPAELPLPPLNLVGDFGGGGMYAVVGVMAALYERHATGHGQIIDVAMIDGAASLLGPIRNLLNDGVWKDERAANWLDGGAPFYRTYRTADERFVAVGALEPRFYSALLAGLNLEEETIPDRMDRDNWPALAEMFAAAFAQRSRDEWQEIFDGSDACVTPVLTITEAGGHRHNLHRGAMVESPRGPRPAPAPRFETP